MNRVSSILGLDLPILQARREIVMKSNCSSSLSSHFEAQGRRHPPKVVSMKWALRQDDDTISTVSTSDSDLEDSNSFTDSSNGGNCVVSFSEPLVTHVRTRPYTSSKDKYCLYYSNYDYLEFRREAHGGAERPEKIVKFAENLVTKVEYIIPPEDLGILFYSKEELQR
jgi:hypothetical protein